jgi:hypothetical protein
VVVFNTPYKKVQKGEKRMSKEKKLEGKEIKK